VLASVLSLNSAGFAQNALPPEIITASDLSEAQKESLRRFVDLHKAGLAGEASEVKRARNALIEPLQSNTISVPFRLEYARVLIPLCRPLATGQRELNAINALRLVGELATSTGLDLLTDSLADKRDAVRLMAVKGFGATFSAIERTNPAIPNKDQAIRVLGTLKTNIEKETNPQVLEAYTLSLQAATRIPTAKLADVRAEAIKVLSQSIGSKARAATDGKFDSAFRRAANAARNALTNQNAANEPALPDDIFREAGALGGDLLALVHRRVKAGELTTNPAKRSDLVLMVSDSERTIQWAANGLSVEAQDLKLSELLQQSKDTEFQTAVLRLIGANGVLTAQKFRFADDHFVK